MRKFSIAPMMACTDRHFRYFARLMTARALLYTEMITQDAVIHGDRDYLLAYHDCEHPIALQLGGSDPEKLALCVKIAEEYAYDEINLNVGCPSDRVQSGKIGACLMNEPDLVAECVSAMKSVTDIPITVKTRLGVDHNDSYDFIIRFTEKQKSAGADALIVHARKAWLKGLSTRKNRQIPPLDYQRVYQLKQDFPDFEIIINGGINDLDEVKAHLQHVDGVMLGRAAYNNSYLLSQVDHTIFSEQAKTITREKVIERFKPYLKQQIENEIKQSSIVRHLLGLYHGQPGAKAWRSKVCSGAVFNL